MDFKIEPEITKNYLLSKFSEETFMEYYLGIPVAKKLYRNPLRKDDKPTCSFYRNKSGELIFKDFSGFFYGNFISVVMFKYSCTYHKALRIIANDFGLIHDDKIQRNRGKINKNAPVFKDDGTAIIQVEIKDFSKSESEWWGDYGITDKILKKYHVFSCKNVFLNGNVIATSSSHCPIYGYYGGKKEGIELWRIYFPKRKSYRFLSNWDSKKIQGIKQLPDEGKLLVITKSLKDTMCLYSLGIPAIAPNSETLEIRPGLLEDLQSRFKHIVYFYDNDLPGISNMKKIKREFPDLLYYWLPRSLGAKDISDFYKKYGKKTTISFINKEIKNLKDGKKTKFIGSLGENKELKT